MVRDITVRHAGSDQIKSDFRGKDIVSLDQFDIESLALLFQVVPRMRAIAINSRPSDILSGILASLIFYEPSTRTRCSFEAAINQLGGRAMVIENPQQFSSFAKGESLEDAICTYEAYCDLIVLRHREDGAALRAANVATRVPVFNAGDGTREHPTQALLDLFTVYEQHERLDGLTGLFVGDIKHGRTVHSLLKGLSLFPRNTAYLMSPTELALDFDHLKELQRLGLTIKAIEDQNRMPNHCDFIYCTRIQKERMSLEVYDRVKDNFIITSVFMRHFSDPKMILMHPLPRVNEIHTEVDADPRAVYLTSQIRNGMYVRMALAALVFDQIPKEWEIPGLPE